MGFLALVIVMVLLVLWAAASSGAFRGVKELSRDHRSILTKYAIHYQRLDDPGKHRFERIVSSFVNDKEWVGAGMQVGEEMKVMISACAAQLLRGFPDITLAHFERLVVYPDTYRSHKSGRMHQGEVRPVPGIIIISWDDFVRGYAHSRDAHNVGLHEMAHALWFENDIDNEEHQFLDVKLLAEWKEGHRRRSGRSRPGNHTTSATMPAPTRPSSSLWPWNTSSSSRRSSERPCPACTGT